eukprot:TRINITY_DN16991_c0_g1_i1.p1 TRINITY_DN16991_c0_g1~~TRINITY_DN16991_c0_g1_i1.p1  ORF type:complete len:442 (+),score=88.84 TRINITY_DN16991_c0_g1_i1:135-1328(+)
MGDTTSSTSSTPSTPIKKWWPDNPPIYDSDQTYAINAERGPFLPKDFIIPERPHVPKDKWIDFLGFKISSPIGIPAGPLLNSRWTTFSAKVGFDVITYKTIRSVPREGHPLPNVMYIDTLGSLTPERFGEVLHTKKSTPSDISDIAITNSFGMPSRDREYLKEDIKKAREGIKEGQVLIVSVVGSVGGGCSNKEEGSNDFFDDYVNTAVFAVQCGAQMIEANFSCPNVVTGEGKIYSNPSSVFEISSRMVKELNKTNTPLIIKVGVFDSEILMRQVFHQAVLAGVKGICGINTLSMKVVGDDGQPALGKGREVSGICGAPIRQVAVQWTKTARKIIDEEKLPLALLSCGGAMNEDHLDEFLSAGADVVLTATGMMWDPLLALRWHYKHAEKKLKKKL